MKSFLDRIVGRAANLAERIYGNLLISAFAGAPVTERFRCARAKRRVLSRRKDGLLRLTVIFGELGYADRVRLVGGRGLCA